MKQLTLAAAALLAAMLLSGNASAMMRGLAGFDTASHFVKIKHGCCRRRSCGSCGFYRYRVYPSCGRYDLYNYSTFTGCGYGYTNYRCGCAYGYCSCGYGCGGCGYTRSWGWDSSGWWYKCC